MVSITLAYVPLDLILPDQPNRAVRTRMLRGVGGGSCEAPPYPDNHWLRKAADIQYTSTLITAFQNDWHDRTSVLMRAAIKQDAFRKTFDKAVKKAYGSDSINYKDISSLLNPKINNNIQPENPLESFEEELHKLIFSDPLSKDTKLFTAYEAIYRVLLSFDRLAIMRNEPTAWKKFIQTYRPPIRDLAKILQAFIAIRIALNKNDDDKNYKKDYMQLLNMLGLADSYLYKKCINGLKNRKEWHLLDGIRGKTKRCYKSKTID